MPTFETPALGPLMRVEGRFAPGAGGGVRLGYPGVTLHLACCASTLTMRAQAESDGVYFDLLVDGGPARRLRLSRGKGSYALLGAGAPDALRTLEIVRRTESWQGACEILGFDTGPAGQMTEPSAARDRRLLFIGDSVTCGALCGLGQGEVPDPNEPAGASNARLSYGYLLSRRLGAEVCLVGYGGRGVLRDWQGNRDTANAPEFYGRALPDDPASVWNPAGYVPDAVAIALGTNDFSTGVPDEDEFVEAYLSLIRNVRRDAPGAWIGLVDSPILVDKPGAPPKRTLLTACLRQIAARMGDGRCKVVPLRHYPGLPGDGHPTAAEHVEIADEIERHLRGSLPG